MKRLMMAIKAFWLVLKGEDLLQKSSEPETISKLTEKKEPEVEERRGNHFDNGAVYTLVLLQREGRLIDFLQEKIDAYADEQIGTAVRQIHKNCQKVLSEYYQIQPILQDPEGGKVTFDKNLDPSEIKLTGSPPESPPFQGILRHKGWKVSKLHFPSRSDAVNPHVIQAAEVEINP